MRSGRSAVAVSLTRRQPADFFAATMSGYFIEYHASERSTEATLELAIRHGVTVYDGLYLALAAGNECRVVTADRRLHETCPTGALGQVVSWVRDLR